jgi:hypothetical protein
MSPYNGFILSIVLMLPGSVTHTGPSNACLPMEATVTVSTTDQGHIEILAPRDAKIKVFMLHAESVELPIEMTLTNGRLSSVAPGVYDVIIHDTGKKYCIQTQRLTVN